MLFKTNDSSGDTILGIVFVSLQRSPNCYLIWNCGKESFNGCLFWNILTSTG